MPDRSPAALGGDIALGAATVATMGFAVAALVRPSALTGHPPQPGVGYFAAMYAARALPLGAAVLVGLVTGRVAPSLLAVAAAAQVADVPIGVRARRRGQIFAPALLAAGYVARARFVR